MIKLVQPPIDGRDVTNLAPPLGLLRLAGSVSQKIEIVDLNLKWHEADSIWRNDWPKSALDDILAGDPACVGFTSMAIDSHIALDLAQRIKKRCPDCFVVLGGPHFTQISEYILSTFPAIDAVIAGEAEIVFSRLCTAITDGLTPLGLPGVSTQGERDKRPSLDTTEIDLSSLGPIPFDLVDLERYWRINPLRLLNVELSRGCKYNCTYCYVNGHFGTNPRHLPPEMAADIMSHAQGLGAKRAFVVGDNFLNNREWVIDTCAALSARELDIVWDCYATIPDIDPEIAKALADAGCVTTYIGVDAVEVSQQRAFKKKFFSTWGNVRERFNWLRINGLEPSAAFILNGLGEHRFGTEESIRAAIDLRIRDLALPRINVLSEYPGTALSPERTQHAHCPSEIKIDLLQDVPRPTRNNPYADSAPELYPFHSIYRDEKYGARLVQLAFDTDFLLDEFPYLLHSILIATSKTSQSDTPFLDWWEANFLTSLGGVVEAAQRRKAIEGRLAGLAAAFNLPVVSAAWEIETAFVALRESEDSRVVSYIVENCPVSATTMASKAISSKAASYLEHGADHVWHQSDSDSRANSESRNGCSWRLVRVHNSGSNSFEAHVIQVDKQSFNVDIKVGQNLYPAKNTHLTREQFAHHCEIGLIIDGG